MSLDGSFTPDLLALREAARLGDSLVLKAWIRMSDAAQLAAEAFPDEADLLEALTKDFRFDVLNTLFFIKEPEAIASLRKRHADVMVAPEAHVLAVSRAQYAGMLRLVSEESALDQRKRTLERGISKREALVSDLIREMEQLTIEIDLLNRLHRRGLNILNFDSRPRWSRGSSLSPQQLSQQRIRKEGQRVVALREISSMSNEIKLLQEKLAMIRGLKLKLERLKVRIDQASASTQEVGLDQSLPKEKAAQMPPPNPADKSNGTTPAPKPSPTPKPSLPSPREEMHPMQPSLDRVREAVEIGNRVRSLRILLPSEGRVLNNLRPKWAKLFTALGFTGEMIVSTYQELDRDVTTPLVVPRGMFTHMNFWTPTRQQHMFIIELARPAQLLRFFQSQKTE